jgi:hypothetical protein
MAPCVIKRRDVFSFVRELCGDHLECLCHRVDFDKLLLSVQLLVPEAIFRGKYELSGKLASLPIAGKGNYNTSFSK